jgi:hypothetical protein
MDETGTIFESYLTVNLYGSKNDDKRNEDEHY